MDAERLVKFILDDVEYRDIDDVAEACADFLRDNDWFVAEDEDDLRDLALKETDLIEPE